MTQLAVASQLTVAVIFAASAVTKLFRRQSFQSTLLLLGLSRRATAATRIAIPAAEAIVALLILTPRFERFGLIGAIALIAIFTVVLRLRRLNGADVPCACFGGLSEAGGALVARNTILAGYAGLALHHASLGDARWAAPLLVTVLVLAIAPFVVGAIFTTWHGAGRLAAASQ